MVEYPTDAEKLAVIREKIADAEKIAPHYMKQGIGSQLAYTTAFDKIRGYLDYWEKTFPDLERRRKASGG